MTKKQLARLEELKAKEITSTEEIAEILELEKLLVVPAEEVVEAEPELVEAEPEIIEGEVLEGESIEVKI